MMHRTKQGFNLFLALFITGYCIYSVFFTVASATANDTNIETLNESHIKLEARIDEPVDIDLEKALSLALLQNLDIKYAKNNTGLFKWKLLENYSNYLPDLKAGLSNQRLDGTFLIGGVFPIMTLTSSANAYIRFDHRFLEGGKGFFNTLASKKLYKSSKENTSLITKNTLLQVTKYYYLLLKEQAQLETLSKSVDEAKAILDLNQKLLDQGFGTKFDVLQSDAQYAEQEQLFIDQQKRFRDASINLARELNLDQGVHIRPDSKDLELKNLYNTEKPISEIISEAKINRAEIKKAVLDYNAQKNYIGVAYSGFLPSANVYGQYGGNGRVFFNRTKTSEVVPSAILLDDTGNPVVSMVNRTLYDRNISNVIPSAGKPFLVTTNDSLMASKFIGFQVDWEFGKGLGTSTVTQIQQARFQANLAKTNIDIINQKIEQEVRQSYLNIQTSERALEISRRRLGAAEEALRLAKLRLENGIGINTELLNAQKQYSSALTAQVNAIINYNISQAELVYSIGIISLENLL